MGSAVARPHCYYRRYAPGDVWCLSQVDLAKVSGAGRQHRLDESGKPVVRRWRGNVVPGDVWSGEIDFCPRITYSNDNHFTQMEVDDDDDGSDRHAVAAAVKCQGAILLAALARR